MKQVTINFSTWHGCRYHLWSIDSDQPLSLRSTGRTIWPTSWTKISQATTFLFLEDI